MRNARLTRSAPRGPKVDHNGHSCPRDDFIKRARSAVVEGTSALFLMTSDAVMDRVSERMKNLKFDIIATNLSKEQEDQLREVFAQA